MSLLEGASRLGNKEKSGGRRNTPAGKSVQAANGLYVHKAEKCRVKVGQQCCSNEALTLIKVVKILTFTTPQGHSPRSFQVYSS